MSNRTLFKLFAFIAFCLFLATHSIAAGKYTAFTVKITGHGQPVILIPGATCSGDEWRETVAHMGNKYQYHVLTLAGYAGTPALAGGPYLLTVKDQIEQYIADNKLHDVILVGHSIGGYLSLLLATEMKTSLQQVVIIDAMPFFAGARNPNAADTFSEGQAKAMLASYNQMSDSALMSNQRNAAKFLCLDSTKWDMIATWGVRSDKKTMAYTMCEMLGSDLRKKIADIHVPVLVLAAYAQSPQYPQYTRQYVTDMYGDQYKACTACIVHVAEGNTKHFIMYDNPVWMYAEIDTFLKAKH
jgi:N-formylmaleamate deformylase